MALLANIAPVPIGSEITLSCNAIGIAPLTFNWTRHDDPTVLLSTDSVYTFTVSDSSDYGDYACGVSNRFGSDTETITVLQASKHLNA